MVITPQKTTWRTFRTKDPTFLMPKSTMPTKIIGSPCPREVKTDINTKITLFPDYPWMKMSQRVVFIANHQINSKTADIHIMLSIIIKEYPPKGHNWEGAILSWMLSLLLQAKYLEAESGTSISKWTAARSMTSIELPLLSEGRALPLQEASKMVT